MDKPQKNSDINSLSEYWGFHLINLKAYKVKNREAKMQSHTYFETNPNWSSIFCTTNPITVTPGAPYIKKVIS